MKKEIKPFIGTWAIVEMEVWGQEFVNIFIHLGDDSAFRAQKVQ